MLATSRARNDSPIEVAGGIIWSCIKNIIWAFVRLIEAVWVARDLVDPRVRRASLRIRSVTDGRLSKGTGKVALLVLYADGALPLFTRHFIEALNRSDFDLVAVSNGKLDAVTHSYLLDRCMLLVERDNVGRDFGAYQDGISIIRDRQLPLRKLMLANDSVFYLPAGLDAMIAKLGGEGEFIGVSEVFEHHYHVASFLLSFGPAVIESEAFRRFWKQYRPVGTRRWVILRGEGALTKTLIAAGFLPRVLFSLDALRRHLERKSPDELLAEVRTLPDRARIKLMEAWGDCRAHDAPAHAASRLVGDIVDAVYARNQMHYGGFLFRRYLGMPLVKRDLVYRNVYSLPDALANLDDLDAPCFEAIAADFRKRPMPASYGLLGRLLYRYGAI